MQETILLLRRQLDSALSTKNSKDSIQNIDSNIKTSTTGYELSLDLQSGTKNGVHAYDEMYVDQSTPTSVMSLNRAFSRDSRESRSDALMNSHHEQVTSLEFLCLHSIACFSFACFLCC